MIRSKGLFVELINTLLSTDGLFILYTIKNKPKNSNIFPACMFHDAPTEFLENFLPIQTL